MKAAKKHPEIVVTTGPLPAARKIFVQGNLHEDVRVPLREISLSPAAQEPPLRVYDSSGPYTDIGMERHLDLEAGLAAIFPG